MKVFTYMTWITFLRQIIVHDSIVKTGVICCWISTLTADIYHCFCARENDWGYSNFMALKDMEEKGFIKDDTIVLQAHVKADAPHGIKYVYTCW